MKKLLSTLLSAILAMTACFAVIPEISASASAESLYTLPLPANRSYGVTVLGRYSGGRYHPCYITQYILHEGTTSQPDCVMDIAAPKNTPVYAIADGRVAQNHSAKQHSGGGNNIVICHNDGSYSYYGHLMSQSPLKVGTAVKKGDIVGYVGNTGTAGIGYHIHFEWSGHDPFCEFKAMGYDNLYIVKNSGASRYPHNHNESAPINPTSTYRGRITGTGNCLTINSQPRAGYDIGYIPEGAVCTVYSGRNIGNWQWVSYNGINGYAYGKYITTANQESTDQVNTYQGRITGTGNCLTINSRPSAGYDIGYIPEGATCTVYAGKNIGNWQWVSYNGISGYAYGRYITAANQETTYQGKITGTGNCLAINTKPKAGYAVGYIPEGATCTVYAGKNIGNWQWVSYNGISGYAYGKYIK